MFTPYQVDFISRVNLNLCIISLNSIPVSAQVKVVKTWVNGWATTHRIKGNFFRTCMLGCTDAPDSLAHYLMCPIIYAVCLHVLPNTCEDPLVRCGLCEPSHECLLSVACIFFAYHALKSRVNSEFDECIPENFDYKPYVIHFAQAFCTEAGGLGLYHGLFDHDRFFNRFLMHTPY